MKITNPTRCKHVDQFVIVQKYIGLITRQLPSDIHIDAALDNSLCKDVKRIRTVLRVGHAFEHPA